MNAAYIYVGEKWRFRSDIINFVHVNDSQSIYLWSIPFVNITVGNPFDSLPIIDQSEQTGDRFNNQFVGG